MLFDSYSYQSPRHLYTISQVSWLVSLQRFRLHTPQGTLSFYTLSGLRSHLRRMGMAFPD